MAHWASLLLLMMLVPIDVFACGRVTGVDSAIPSAH